MKLVIADPKQGKCYQTEIDELKSKALYGLKIGNELDGSVIGLAGYNLKITGGTDIDGFPMRKDIHGPERKKIIIAGGTGVRKNIGEKRRKTLRGNTLSESIAQVNLRVETYGPKSVQETFGGAKEGEAPKPEEKKVEEKKPEPKKEEKPKEPEKKEEAPKVEEKVEEPEKKEEVKQSGKEEDKEN